MSKRGTLQTILRDIGNEPVPPDVHQLTERIAGGFRDRLAAESKEPVVHPLKPVFLQPTARTILSLLKRQPIRWSVAAGLALMIAAVVVFSILPSRPVYALEQTAAVLGGKRSFHVRVWSRPGRLKEEFWAEFKPDGQTLRFRQEEPDQTTVWQDYVKTRYYHRDNVLMLTRSNGQENILQRTDPELTVRHVLKRQTEGEATVEIHQPAPGQSELTVVASYTPNELGERLQNVILVDPDTYIVRRIELWRQQGNLREADCSMDILEYNQPIPPATFSLEPPEGAAVIDQVSQSVGLPQGASDLESHATELVRRALESWQAGDDSQAARLFGGVQVDVLSQRLVEYRPVGAISVGTPVRAGKSGWPFVEVPCRWHVQPGSRTESVRRTLTVRGEPVWQKVDDQPTRWWVDVRDLMKPTRGQAARPPRTPVGLEQGASSNEEVAVRVVREFIEALMGGDYAKAGQLTGGVPPEVIRERMSNRRILRIVSIGQPGLHENQPDHYRVEATVEVNLNGDTRTVTEAFSVEPVEDQPGRWEID